MVLTQSNTRSFNGHSAVTESEPARRRMEDLAREKRELLQRIEEQKAKNTSLKQEIEQDYREYSNKVSESTREVTLLKQKYQQYEQEIQEMAAKIE
jgi:predicted RNase H-like nuclease (RuvC/YqgF family)